MDKLIYLYGIIRTKDILDCPLPTFKGLDDEHYVYIIPFGHVQAVVCDLDENEYNEKALEKKTNQIDWLHKKAFHHHEALMKLYENYPIIPMKFCTIYQNVENLESTLEPHKEKMTSLLDSIIDQEEWNVKIYCNHQKLKERVTSSNESVALKRNEISDMSPGRQYLEKRKLDQLIEKELEKEIELFSNRIHEDLALYSVKNEIKKNWDKQVTGRREEMCWNSVYLIETSNVGDFLTVLKNMQKQWEDAGWLIEATGPWPVYHFSNVS